MSVILVYLFIGAQSYAFLDFMAKKGDDAAEGAAIASAMAELVETIGGSEELVDSFNQLEEIASEVERNAYETIYLTKEGRTLMKGINYTSKNRLSSNIRHTTTYIKRLRSFLLRLAAFGSDMATALNTLEMNVGLSEVQKNQQTQIMIEKQKILAETSEKAAEKEQWESFMETERNKRYRTSNE
ncbi:MAG: hypothetical protein KDD37_09615 [Bdellovibrionales bacterium]|nr:hypothetical protein [Bdellovibrionales bacterium]